MKKLRLMILAVFILGPISAEAGTPPDILVKDTIQKIIKLLKQNRQSYERDRNKLFIMVNEIALPHFDFVVMSKWILGRKHWTRANKAQRDRFINAFKELLVRTYAVALLKYTDEEVIYLPFKMKPGARKTIVKVEIKQSGGAENVPMDYSFYNKKSEWKIYDIKISGVSLTSNYRAEYDIKIRKEGLDGLIKSIEKKNKQMRHTKQAKK